MSKHFCFCIPVRLGVFLFSLISFGLSGLSAVLGWFLLHLIDSNQLSKIETDMKDEDKAAFEASLHKYKWAVIVGSIIFTFVALVAFFGFVGSVIRNRRMVKAYSFMTVISFFLGSLAAGFVLYAAYSHKPFCVKIDDVQRCTNNHLNTAQKVGLTIGIVVEWLIQLYIVTIIRRYYQQLEEEREYRHDFRLNPTTGGTYEAKEGLLATQGAYPYSDAQNRFGSHA
ncbi:hypothetical protein C8Q77DRAFT_1156522 [Trametes polyzona]|nr:hypothetical protein C8Q77DRAFT_1156522 [Trametes polyzona]